MFTSLSEFELWHVLLVMISIFFSAGMVFYFMRVKEDRRIERAVYKLGAEALPSIRLPDGMDGDLYIDFILLTARGITAISVKRYEGFIYASEKLERWTQVINGNNYAFPNPLEEMDLKISALKLILPDVEVDGRVLFAGRCSFPKGKPDAVILLDDIVGKAKKEPISEHYYASWKKLHEYQIR